MTKRIGIAILAIFLFAILAAPKEASAHEKWFVKNPNDYDIDLGLLFSWQVLVALLVGATAVVVTRAIDQRYRVWRRARNPDLQNQLIGIREERLSRVYAYLPLLLAIHTAIPLLVSGFQLQLFAPNLQMQPNLLSGILALAEVLIALALVYGVFTNFASIGLIVLFFAGVVFSPLVGLPAQLIPEQLVFVGIAIFLYIIGRGPFSADALLGRRAHPNSKLIGYALPALRWGTGLSIIVLAFSEKLLNPSLAEAFLTQKINFNLGSNFGVNDQLFIYAAGVIEFTFGVLLISGALPRLVIIALWIPFNLTLPYLGWVELAGHLPVYGVILILLIVGPTSRRAAQRSAMILAREAGVLENEIEKVASAGSQNQPGV